MTAEISSSDYRRLMGLIDPDAQQEMSAAEYNRLVKPKTANDLLRSLDSSHVDTEPAVKTAFGAWLDLVSPYPVLREHRGIPGRLFRFDWAIAAVLLAFEYDGVKDHATRRGSERDAEKGNLAQLAGWLFIRVNSGSLRNGTGYQMAMDAFQDRGITLRGSEQ